MALYRFSAGFIARGKGHSSTAAAAYRAGERITDERTGQTYDYTRRSGVLWNGIYAPQNAPEWMQDRGKLWNAVELGEKRKDARTAREFIVAIPHELDIEQSRRLLGDFIREQFARKGFVVDAAIHAPDKNHDHRNIHAHFLVTTRQVQGGRFVDKKDRTQNEKATLEKWREAWARLGNRHLERAGFPGTLDHRNYEDQGIDRTPGQHIDKTAWNMQQRGIQTDVADRAKADQDRRREIADIKAELRKLGVEPEAPRTPSQPANDAGRSTDRPANDNAPESKRGPFADPPILKAEPQHFAQPAGPVSLSPAVLQEPSPPPQPATRERVEIRPPTAEARPVETPAPQDTKAPPRAEEPPAKVEVSPQTSKPAERPPDTSKRPKPAKAKEPRLDRKPKADRQPSKRGLQAMFSAVTGWTRSVFGGSRPVREKAMPDSLRPEIRQPSPPPQPMQREPVPARPAAERATAPMPPTPTPTPQPEQIARPQPPKKQSRERRMSPDEIARILDDNARQRERRQNMPPL